MLRRHSLHMTNETGTAAAAAEFVEQAELRAAPANVPQPSAGCVAGNFITHATPILIPPATQILAARATEKQIALGVDLAKDAARFDAIDALSYDVRRKLGLLK